MVSGPRCCRGEGGGLRALKVTQSSTVLPRSNHIVEQNVGGLGWILRVLRVSILTDWAGAPSASTVDGGQRSSPRLEMLHFQRNSRSPSQSGEDGRASLQYPCAGQRVCFVAAALAEDVAGPRALCRGPHSRAGPPASEGLVPCPGHVRVPLWQGQHLGAATALH